MHLSSNMSWREATRHWWGRVHPHSAPGPRIGLALGGGFARGIAHVGVLRVLEQHNIPIHCISGVSAGAMVAAAYASGSSPSEIEQVGRSMKFSDVARWTINRLGLAGSDRMVRFLGRLLKTNRFEDMKIPLAVVATDLCSGKPAVFKDHGEVITPIRASCSFPGLFLPVRHENRYLIDGFVGMEVPAQPLRRMGATHVIAVSLPNPKEGVDPSSLVCVIQRCFQVMSERLQGEWRKHAQLVIEPDVADVGWNSFISAQKLIEMGEQAALAAIPTIQGWLSQAKGLTKFHKLSSPIAAITYREHRNNSRPAGLPVELI
jgi:NTE family protein